MAELGAGAGSGYPAVIDTDATLETAADYARIAVPNDLAAAIVAIETELGADPAGTAWATVVARLAAVSAIGGGVPKGLASARPSAATGVLYRSTDTQILEYSDGTAWFPLLGG